MIGKIPDVTGFNKDRGDTITQKRQSDVKELELTYQKEMERKADLLYDLIRIKFYLTARIVNLMGYSSAKHQQTMKSIAKKHLARNYYEASFKLGGSLDRILSFVLIQIVEQLQKSEAYKILRENRAKGLSDDISVNMILLPNLYKNDGISLNSLQAQINQFDEKTMSLK
jgi:hypothetical protein